MSPKAAAGAGGGGTHEAIGGAAPKQPAHRVARRAAAMHCTTIPAHANTSVSDV